MSIATTFSIQDKASHVLERIAASYERVERAARRADAATRRFSRPSDQRVIALPATSKASTPIIAPLSFGSPLPQPARNNFGQQLALPPPPAQLALPPPRNMGGQLALPAPSGFGGQLALPAPRGPDLRESNNQLNQFRSGQERAGQQAKQIQSTWSHIKGLVGGAAALMAVRQLVQTSDTVVQVTARLDLMNDGSQTTEELEEKLMASANRARSSYVDTAAAVAKLGILAKDAFDSNDEIIAFTELMNKNFVVGGASASEKSSAMYQLTQAMASGRLQGDEYRSIIENAPLLATSIEDYMKNMLKVKGTMKEWSREGLLTTEVIKAAVFSSAAEVEARFKKMPMTWGEVWKLMGNVALQVFNPILLAINWLANNLSIVLPLVLGIGAAFLVFQIGAHWVTVVKIATMAYHAANTILSIGLFLLTGNVAAATTAFKGLFATLALNPITLVVMGIVLLIAALYAGVAMFNKFTNSTVSATGIVVGAVFTLAAHVLNTLIIPIQRELARFGNFFCNVFKDPVAAVKILFLDMAISLLGYIANVAKGIAELVNSIPGVEIGIITAVATGAEHLKQRAEEAKVETQNISGLEDVFKAWDYIDYKNTYEKGYSIGEGVEDKVVKGLNFDVGGIGDFNVNNVKKVDEVGGEVNIAEEDLKFLRDVAELRYIQNYVTLTPTVSMQANIKEEADADLLLEGITRKLEEEFYASAEGVYT